MLAAMYSRPVGGKNPMAIAFESPKYPPTPPGIRFRTKAVPAKPLCFCLIACLPISAQPYLADSVRYLQL